MKKNIQSLITIVLFCTTMIFSGIGMRETILRLQPSGIRLQENTVTEVLKPDAGSLTPSFISGPLAASTGELCVFRLNDPALRADWVVIRQSSNDAPLSAYIDSSGSSLVFASNVDAQYTVVAAVIEEGNPKILQHVCDYGLTPEPKPNPTPKPNPEPQALSEWIKQNIPASGQSQSNILASVYEAASLGIEQGTIKTPEAAFSSVRTNTQTKINITVWNDFLDKLSEKINERYTGNREIKELGVIFNEIADGLNVRLQTSGVRHQENVTEFPLKPEARCLEPQCQPHNIEGGHQ